MIPINEAIESGAWLQARLPAPSPSDGNFITITIEGDKENELEHKNLITHFHFKVTDFSKIVLTDIDNPEYLEVSLESNIWLLKFEIINVLKDSVPFYDIEALLQLTDDEGYKFSIFKDDSYLLSNSSFAKKSGLASLRFKNLAPKIRKLGAFAFELPDEFDTLFITVKGGEISEV